MKNSPAKPQISILGARAAGLAAGYYARKADLPLTIYEADQLIGGNAVTIKRNDFLFDSGAPRIYNRPPKTAIIIGAGQAGLTATFELLERTDL